MKRCSTTLDIRIFKLNPQWDITAHLPEWQRVKYSDSIKCWQGCGKTVSFICFWWECKMVQLLWKTVRSILKSTKNKITYDPEILLLGIYQKKWRHVHAKFSNRIFVTVLFITAPHWRPLRCVSVGEWLNRLWSLIPRNITQHKMEIIDTHNNLNKFLQNYAEWKKNNPKISSMIPFMQHSQNNNYRNG